MIFQNIFIARYLNFSIDIKNYCNEAQFLMEEIIMRCLTIKVFHGIFYNSQFNKNSYNSAQSYNRKIWFDIPSYILVHRGKTSETVFKTYFDLWIYAQSPIILSQIISKLNNYIFLKILQILNSVKKNVTFTIKTL